MAKEQEQEGGKNPHGGDKKPHKTCPAGEEYNFKSKRCRQVCKRTSTGRCTRARSAMRNKTVKAKKTNNNERKLREEIKKLKAELKRALQNKK